MSPTRVFILSPANAAGARAAQLIRKDAGSALAERLRSSSGAALGEVFTYVSRLYFRGKLEYASAFARPPSGGPGVLIVVPGRGLRPPSEPIRPADLRRMARIAVDPGSRKYRTPLVADAGRLDAALPDDAEVVLLGSIATDKYLGPLADPLGDRLRVPRELVGVGMMSRGALLRRCAAEGRQLTYRAPCHTTE